MPACALWEKKLCPADPGCATDTGCETLGIRIYIDNTDLMGYPARCIRGGRPFVTGPVEGPQTPKPGPGANGPPTRIQRVRVFQPVCIVFISPPEVEMCVL